MSTPSPTTTAKPKSDKPEVSPEDEFIVEWMKKFGVTIQKAADLLAARGKQQPSTEPEPPKLTEEELQGLKESYADTKRDVLSGLVALRKIDVGEANRIQGIVDEAENLSKLDNFLK